ncbi:OmpP1/FadL family transporter [Geothrix sp. PMB-07]|uniref:OmpP1/FadL family transporter n=1 Tax=Geothrix sp. PMB-07 TaxID=3068640 RepID=UPI002740A2F4|nr:outer membrane protein transport protein [Geothrix sp. PMB-07]WLT32942.1 outer membrane protein transport protein [Geothrix sp. PMB-07]
MPRALQPSRALLSLLLVGSATGTLMGSGFQLREQSPSAQGNAFAGISAGGTDIGSMFFNVATLTRFEGNQAVLGFSSIQPSARLESGQASRATLLGATPVSGSAGGDAGRSAILPVAYALWSASPDLKLGLSVNSPFGLGSEYEANWIGRYHAVKSQIKVVEIAPNVAWRLDSHWSVGAALVARYVDAELTNAVDFGAVGAALHVPGSVPGAQDGTAKVTGHQWKYGYKLGVLFEPTQQVRLGAAYHSRLDFALQGEVRYEGVPTALKAAFPDGGSSPRANQPATASLGIAWEAAPGLTLQAEAAQTFWNCFQDIRIEFASGQSTSVTEEKWKNTWFKALGTTWKPNATWTFRAGLAKDQAATSDSYRTPRIPDADRTWISGGLGYAFNRALGLDLSYSHILVKDSTLNLKAGSPGTPDFFRGNVSGTYRNRIQVLALQARYSF